MKVVGMKRSEGGFYLMPWEQEDVKEEATR